MACVYPRERSPFWWLHYKNDGVWKLKSTGLRYDNELQTAQAQLILSVWKEREVNERTVQGVSVRSDPSYDWSWVDDWPDNHCKNPRTRIGYGLHWRHIQHWLAVSKIRHPREISCRHGQEYILWRVGGRAGRKVCAGNTALTE